MKNPIALAAISLLLLQSMSSISADETQSSWAWGGKSQDLTPDLTQAESNQNSNFEQQPSEYNQDEIVNHEYDQNQNSTKIDQVIDDILSSTRQGRALEGYDQVYTDPNVQDALQKGDDSEARNVIKDRLCLLGLMQCDEEIEGKRPYISPEELIYAQPVAINPVGKPIPTIPIKNVRGQYGAAKPVPYPPTRPGPGPGSFPGKGQFRPPSANKYPGPLLNSKYPSQGPNYAAPNKPPRRGYGPVSSGLNTFNNKPFYGSGKPILSDGEIYAEGDYLNKPPGPEYFSSLNKPITSDSSFASSIANNPYQFELSSSLQENLHKEQNKKVEITVNAQSATPSTVEHVHHHYHHGAADGGKVVNPISVGAAAAAVSTSFDGSAVTVGSSGLSSFSTAGANGINGGFSPSLVDSYGTSLTAADLNGGHYGASNGLGSSLTVNGVQGGSYGGQTLASYGGSASLNNIGSVKPVVENYGPQSFGHNNFGTSIGSYGSSANLGGSNLYKKELNVNAINNNYLQSSYADKYQGLESSRTENYDCVCVPYNQCPSHDVIGRKDDLYLPLDPRSLKSDIEADTEERVITDGNGTMSVVRVTKETKPINITETEDSEKKPKDEVKKVSKREAPATKREDSQNTDEEKIEGRQAYYGRPQTCGPRHVCCRKPNRPHIPSSGANKQCGTRHSQGINGRIKNPVYVDGDSEFGEYPWQVAILKKDPKESVYVCGGTLIDNLHIITAAHCVKQYSGPHELRVRLGEWDVNHDVEFYPYIERDVISVNVHPEFYAGTLYNDLAILRMDKPVDWSKHPHISPACLPYPHDDYTGSRCWTTGWGKDAFGDFGKYQNILKEVDVPIINFGQCQRQLQNTRLGYDFRLHPGFVCAGGEEGKDACKGDGGGPMVCEKGGTWQVVGVVSWGIGCGQVGVPGVYVKVAHYLDWIKQVTQRY